MLLRPDFGPDNVLFPSLPPIHSDAIRQRVFTHRSLGARPAHIFEDHPDDPSPDNERYEHLGDTVLGLVVTGLMFDMYPGLHVGPSTKIRALVVGNGTLADVSLRYRLPDRLRLHPAQAITLRASTHIQADVFESYVGGLYRDQNLDAVKAWLHPLFKPYVEEAYKAVRMQHGLPLLPPLPRAATPPSPFTGAPPLDGGNLDPADPVQLSQYNGTPTTGHLALFNQHIQKENMEIEWVYSDNGGYGFGGFIGKETAEVPGARKGTKTTPVWAVKAMVNGEFYGSGRGTSKKAARHEAAKECLQKLGIFVW